MTGNFVPYTPDDTFCLNIKSYDALKKNENLIRGSRFFCANDDFPDLTVIGDVRDKEKLTELLRGTDVVVLLAAEHWDDVSPLSLYYEVNVGGMQNTLAAMEANGVKRIVFTSPVAVYGIA